MTRHLLMLRTLEGRHQDLSLYTVYEGLIKMDRTGDFSKMLDSIDAEGLDELDHYLRYNELIRDCTLGTMWLWVCTNKDKSQGIRRCYDSMSRAGFVERLVLGG